MKTEAKKEPSELSRRIQGKVNASIALKETDLIVEGKELLALSQLEKIPNRQRFVLNVEKYGQAVNQAWMEKVGEPDLSFV